MVKWNKGNGFTLLSVLIAALVIATGSMAAVALVVRADQLAQGAQERFIAVQLAREGLELVRARRDSNWLARQTWISGLCDPGGEASFAGGRSVILDTAMNRAGAPIVEVDPATAGRLHVIPVTAPRGGEWTHEARAPAQPSRYDRVIRIDCAQQQEGRLVVSSLVGWGGRPGGQRLVLTEELYDWQPAQ